ncbi:hypothetical protein B296_00028523 [Ensete ventricosum]|uniref:Uncharacterized protein n=1 Tax=Ensete ventricosum TaxID=4639 RepID=A0A426ZSJ0_ENSVE|nr:hypothetical protein B296_00028523 [Ensete ventricosum]
MSEPGEGFNGDDKELGIEHQGRNFRVITCCVIGFYVVAKVSARHGSAGMCKVVHVGLEDWRGLCFLLTPPKWHEITVISLLSQQLQMDSELTQKMGAVFPTHTSKITAISHFEPAFMTAVEHFLAAATAATCSSFVIDAVGRREREDEEEKASLLLGDHAVRHLGLLLLLSLPSSGNSDTSSKDRRRRRESTGESDRHREKTGATRGGFPGFRHG